MMDSREKEKMLRNILLKLKRFGKSRTCEEETEMLVNTVPLSTPYKNKWAANIFPEWIRVRASHCAALE